MTPKNKCPTKESLNLIPWHPEIQIGFYWILIYNGQSASISAFTTPPIPKKKHFYTWSQMFLQDQWQLSASVPLPLAQDSHLKDDQSNQLVRWIKAQSPHHATPPDRGAWPKPVQSPHALTKNGWNHETGFTNQALMTCQQKKGHISTC